MKSKFIIVFTLVISCMVTFAQRKASVVHVDKDHKIKGEPYITLPKTAVKMNMSLVEFTYSAGNGLKDLIKIQNYSCSDSLLKVQLSPLEKKYGVNPDILIKLLRQQHLTGKDDTTIYKLDKDIKTTFVSMADYDKVYKYTGIKKKALNSNLLNLVYDENGVLVSSKQTSESKIFPAILSTISGLVSIGGAIKGTDNGVAKTDTIKSNCVWICSGVAGELDGAIQKYKAGLDANLYNDKQFEESNKKKEEDVTKAFEELFYSKEIRTIPLQLAFIIPGDSNFWSANQSDTSFGLFAYDKSSQTIVLNRQLKSYILATPEDRFTVGNPTNAVKLKLSVVESKYDKVASLEKLIDMAPDKKTAVYNIPKTERFRLEKPGSKEAYIDTTLKVPQHGKVGYFNLRLSSLELTYDANGELKSFAAENKSSLDTNITGGAGAIKDIITLTKEKSEMDKLKEKADRLELEKKIRDLENDTSQ